MSDRHSSLRALANEARELAEKATPGPWAWEDLGDKGGNAWAVGQFYRVDVDNAPLLSGRIESESYDEVSKQFVRVIETDRIVCDSGMLHDDNPSSHDAAFIAYAREGVPKLCAALLEMIAENENLRLGYEYVKADADGARAALQRVEALCDDDSVRRDYNAIHGIDGMLIPILWIRAALSPPVAKQLNQEEGDAE